MLPRGLFRKYFSIAIFITRILDFSIVLLSAILSYIYLGLHISEITVSYKLAILLALILTPVYFSRFGAYDSWRGRPQMVIFRSLIVAWLGVLLTLTVIAFMTKTGHLISRQWFFLWAVHTSVLLIGYRIILMQVLRYFRTRGMNHRRVLIVGAGLLGKNVLQQLKSNVWYGLDVVAFMDDNSSLGGKTIDHVPVITDINRIEKTIQDQNIDEVWIALPLRSEDRVKDIMNLLKNSTVNIRFVPDIFGFHLFNHSMTEVAGLPVIDISSTPISGGNRIIKGLEDRLLSTFILTLISPLLATIAIAIKLTSPGPVLFKQLRHGWDGKPIKVYKFRTMYIHKEETGNVTQAKPNDLRITRLGAFLRRTSLDELPQFINVLQGRMSIVGPRPHAIEHNEYYKDHIENYMKRHKVKPGITGWAQVNGWRGETDTLDKMQNRINYDLYYIENWSLLFDLKIILLTLVKGFVHKNAY